jgi:hypothetical protein
MRAVDFVQLFWHSFADFSGQYILAEEFFVFLAPIPGS